MSLPELNLNKEFLPKLGLNEKQLEAAIYFDSPLLILAGAGTGKTKTLTAKVALLINSGISASRILAITFTNKAAEEMRQRISAIVPESHGLWVYTFHAFGARILRQHWQKAELKKDFVIYDEEDQKKLIKNICEELGLSKEAAKAPVYASLISRAKDDMLDAQSYMIHAEVSGDSNRIMAGKIYMLYEQKLKQANAVDFGDLIMKPVKLIRDDNDLCAYYREYFRYILVDEYQDTNRAQYLLVKLLSQEHHNICVVGDPDQSIYSWRGADIRNILDFEKDFKDARTIILEQNYRSTASILDAANKLISHNKGRKEKNLWTANDKGEKIKVFECQDEVEEAYIAAQKAMDLKRKRANYRDFVIFYRTNAQSRNFEEVFRKNKIPYRIIGSVRFYERKEIKDAIAYIRVFVNPLDSVSLERIINLPPRGIGLKALETIKIAASRRGLPLYEALLAADDIEGLSPSVRKGIRDFVKIFEDLKSDIFGNEPHYLFEKILEKSNYLQMLRDSAEKDPQDALNRLGNIQELVNAIKDFEETYKKRGELPTLQKYLEEITLQSEVDNLEEDSDAVTLMTLHLAKGLEFPYVMLTGLEEGLFPINAATCNEEDMEEERRLMYVGMTRAKKQLYLSWARTRRIFGKTYPNLMSRFIFESQVIDFSQNKEPEKEKIISAYEFPRSTPARGRRVAHPLYGIGRIVNVIGTGEFTKVTVSFDSGVKQTFMLKFAPLEIF